MVSLPKKIPIWGVVGLVLLASVGTGAALTIVTVDNNPLNPGSGTVTSSTDLTLKSQDLIYTGTDVTAADVTVSNAVASDHTGDIQVVIQDSSGTIVGQGTATSVTFTGSSDTPTSVTLDTSVDMSKVGSVEVVVEQTS